MNPGLNLAHIGFQAYDGVREGGDKCQAMCLIPPHLSELPEARRYSLG